MAGPVLLGAAFGATWIGWYLTVASLFHGHNNGCGGAARVAEDKEFVRIRLTRDHLRAWVIGFDVRVADAGELRLRKVDEFTLCPSPAPGSQFSAAPPSSRRYHHCMPRVATIVHGLLACAVFAALRPPVVSAQRATSFQEPAGAPESAVANGPAADSVRALQQRILADPRTAAQVQALHDDPDVQAVLADPEIAKALARGDVAALLANPKLQRLADGPAVKDLTRQVDE